MIDSLLRAIQATSNLPVLPAAHKLPGPVPGARYSPLPLAGEVDAAQLRRVRVEHPKREVRVAVKFVALCAAAVYDWSGE